MSVFLGHLQKDYENNIVGIITVEPFKQASLESVFNV